MTIEPEGIRQTMLRRRLRGYDREATHVVLEQVAASYEALLQERDVLAHRIAEADRELADLRCNEQLINETLLVATRRAGEVKEAAEQDAALLLARAREHASRIEQEAAARRARSEETTRELERLAELTRTRLTTCLSQTLQKLQRELETGADGVQRARTETESAGEQAPLGTLRLEPSPAPDSVA